jgi:hypothetical protein
MRWIDVGGWCYMGSTFREMRNNLVIVCLLGVKIGCEQQVFVG